MCSIALVGDYDPQVTAHAAIPRALEIARRELGVRLDWRWIGTEEITDTCKILDGHAGVWVVPASPYKNMDGALAAIRYARENRVPFLGTCGGFQHALIEFARHVAGLPRADHAETASGTGNPIGYSTGEPEPKLIVTKLACSLVEKSDKITFAPGSQLHEIFGGRPIRGEYHCSYGVNAAYRARLETHGLRFTGFDAAGDIRAAELPSHPFFIGTLFQPERSGLRGERHPFIETFVRAVVAVD
jgi:CTP synthase (UTP-ammonia lyase)